ncbi:hypothetical protein BS78_10G133400 [Paspalum vaginatum]|nr:hypothetical protein BS78_10G133400 [Paspalum vaginatum]
MCLPFDRGGDHRDHRSAAHHAGNSQQATWPPPVEPPLPSPPPSPPPPLLLSPPPPAIQVPSVQEHGQPYSSPVEETDGHGGSNNGGALAAQGHLAGVHNNGECTTTAALGTSHAEMHGGSGGVVQGPKMSARIAQAHQHKDVSASPLHLYGSAAASHPKAAAGKMSAPPVLHMARQGGEDDD